MRPEVYFWGGGSAFQISVCAAAIYVWDLAVTFQDERRLIWKTRFAKANLLYFWGRYYGLAGLFIYIFFPQGLESSTVCLKRQGIRYALIQLAMSTTQLWTLKQTFFLYDRSRRVLVFMFFTVAISAAFQSYGMTLYFRHLAYSKDCQRVGDRPVGIIVWTVGTVSMQAVVFATSLFKFIKGLRNGINTPAAYVNYIVARDNLVASLFILTVYTSATIIRSKFGVGENIWNFAWAWVFAFLNMATYRTVLNYREAQLTSVEFSTSTASPKSSFTIPASVTSTVSEDDDESDMPETPATLSPPMDPRDQSMMKHCSTSTRPNSDDEH
ncbi:hypothetical protein K435DRAFT_961782 [Dendrothele bispora CBS 962.96]|uniref:DUF6533 domain-containing protein n=1 Tax=Dendrothele bispora (strain CBS 962.96) TaxID=1314807 RepID=A0A4S8MP58_DENBC|nr:hypothetical protein K435DRAFT_961782 [Dendrothele bispora CBS 962.96]